MEHVSHPCHQCNAEVEEGTAFCRQCGAPQIRVSRGGNQEQPPDSATAPGQGSVVSSSPDGDRGRKTIDRRVARWQAALAGILVAVFITLSSLSPLVLLLIPLAGMAAVQLYLRRVPGQKISPGVGAGLGLLTGFFGFLIYGVPSVSFQLWCLTYHPDWAPVQEIRAQVENAIRNNPNPQAQQLAHTLLSPGGLVVLVIAGTVLLLILALILSAIGGAIGAGLSSRRR